MICCGGISDIGNFRENNEDSIFYAVKTLGGIPACLGAVCDGVGGLKDGEIASGIISEQLGKWFGSIKDGDFGALSNSLLQRINKVNAMIIEKTQIEDIQTGSTVAAVFAVGNDYMALNVGDSRIYMVSKGVAQISEDDVTMGGGKLSQCVGCKDNIYINTFQGTAVRGDAFIICSDGFYKTMTDKRLKSAAKHIKNEKSCKKKIEQMIAYAKKQGERDNISAVIIKIL